MNGVMNKTQLAEKRYRHKDKKENRINNKKKLENRMN